MKARFSLLILMSMVCLLLAGSAQARDQTKLKAQVEELLAQAAAAFDKNDLAAVLATSVPDATIKYQDGRAMTMAQWGKVVAKDLADWKDAKTTFAVEQVWPKGKDGAGALYAERHEFFRLGDPGHKYVIKSRFKAFLRKTSQGWSFCQFIDLGTKLTRDGKPFKIQPAPQIPGKKAK